MAKSKPAPAAPGPPAEYTVVARRYRPQQFAELIGQEHVAQALVNALQSGRVAHAYLFTGARGVGKTSAARILAKALNCVTGPTATPCDQCDSCLAIAAGEDVDVLEIDGASNNKVEEVRDLRQNVGFRPTRSRYKVYIIDEVHMLSTSAFNALLKTLEEPPPHVKFIFATTEVQKIPITILSRCQRFDFAHVGPAKIFEQLKRVVEREGHTADDEALRLVARRAAGSMRDSQSLLDQLLASVQGKLTAEHVHATLGTAGEERVTELAARILGRDVKAALGLVGTWADRGLQIGELVDQLVEYWRALMLIRCGPDVQELPVSPATRATLFQQAGTLSLDTILAGLDVWATTKARMRTSTHAQVLLEMAVVRLCRMDEVLSVGQLLQSVGQGVLPAPRPSEPDPSKKNGPAGLANGVTRENNGTIGAAEEVLPLTEENLASVWARLLHHLGERAPILANHLKLSLPPAIFGPNSLAIRFATGYNHACDACSSESNTQKIQETLRKLTGQVVTVRFERVTGPPAPDGTTNHPAPPVSRPSERRKALMDLPLFKKAAEALGAQLWHADDGFHPIVLPLRRPGTAAPEPELEAEPEAEPEPDPMTDPDEG